MSATVEQVVDWHAQPAEWRQRMVDLGERLREHAAQIAAAEYRWLVLLEEFDRGGGWAEQGARTCSQWLSWACGLSPVAARERVRVAAALPKLPTVSEAFRSGRLSYSKVRAITRIATPDNEELLTAYGLSTTASQLERIVRDHRRVLQAQDDEEEHKAFERRSLQIRHHDDGTSTLTLRLPTDAMAEVGATIDGIEERLRREAREAPSGSRDGGDEPTVSPAWERSSTAEARRADAVLVMCDTVRRHGPSPVGGAERYQVVVHTAAEALPGAAGPMEDAHADDESETSRRAYGATGPRRGDPEGSEARLPMTARSVELVAAGPRLDRGGGIATSTARMLACDASVVWLVEDAEGAPVGVTEKTRTVPVHLRRAVLRRDEGCCRFPGCTNRFVDVHHVWHWAHGGPHEVWNLVLLCRFHHRLVHHTAFEVVAYGDQTFSFHRPDGTGITQGLDLPGADPEAVARDNAAAGTHPDQDSLVPDWDGTRPDYDYAAEVLQRWSFPERGAAVPSAATAG